MPVFRPHLADTGRLIRIWMCTQISEEADGADICFLLKKKKKKMTKSRDLLKPCPHQSYTQLNLVEQALTTTRLAAADALHYFMFHLGCNETTLDMLGHVLLYPVLYYQIPAKLKTRQPEMYIVCTAN